MLVNAPRDAAEVQQRIEAPLSYLAVGEMLSRLTADNPFAKSNPHVSTYAQNLPQTDAVAENAGTTVMEIRGQSLVRSPDGSWMSWEAPSPALAKN